MSDNTILTDKSKKELLAICSELGIQKCSSKTKNDLIEIINQNQKMDDGEKNLVVVGNINDFPLEREEPYLAEFLDSIRSTSGSGGGLSASLLPLFDTRVGRARLSV